MKKRAEMMLDWLFAGLAANTLNGLLRGANSRADGISVAERWYGYASLFAWLNFNAWPPRKNFGAFAYQYAYLAANYEVPEVIYRIAIYSGNDPVMSNGACQVTSTAFPKPTIV